MHQIAQIDRKLFFFINHFTEDPWVTTFFKILSSELFGALVLCLLTLYCFYRLRKKAILWLIFLSLTLATSDIICFYVLKPALQRERPCHKEDNYRLRIPGCGSVYGFPSNHASNAMAVSIWFLLILGGKISVFLFFCALLVGLSRVYLGMHYPLDVFVGFWVGGVCSLFYFFLFKNFITKRKLTKI